MSDLLGGKTLIDRQMDALRSCGISDIFVVTGHLREKVRAEGAKILKNDAYVESGNALSIMAAKDRLKDKCLMVFSDILFDRQILEKLVASPHAITLVIDRGYRALPYRDKKIDLVVADEPEVSAHPRKLDRNDFRRVRRVGRRIDPREANYEFIGRAYFKDEGLAALKRAWETALVSFKNSPYFEAENTAKADINDVIQSLIDGGFPVHGLEIEHGWSEIHSLDDYQRVKAHFEGKPQPVLSKT